MIVNVSTSTNCQCTCTCCNCQNVTTFYIYQRNDRCTDTRTYWFYPPEPEEEEGDAPAYEPPYLGEPEHRPWQPARPWPQDVPPRKLASYPQFRRHAMRESRRPPVMELDE